MPNHITVTLTRAPAEALDWITGYGIQEKAYVLDSHLVSDYNAEAEAEQRQLLIDAGAAYDALQDALRQASV
jgi:hypothetical protein